MKILATLLLALWTNLFFSSVAVACDPFQGYPFEPNLAAPPCAVSVDDLVVGFDSTVVRAAGEGVCGDFAFLTIKPRLASRGTGCAVGFLVEVTRGPDSRVELPERPLALN